MRIDVGRTALTTAREKFEILQRIWPRTHIKDFVEAHDEERTCSLNLFKFLEGKGSKLPRILRVKTHRGGPVKFQNLHLSAKQGE